MPIRFLLALLAIAAGPLPSQAFTGWSEMASMGAFRSDHTATLLPDGRVLVTGGEITKHDFHISAELYDPATGTWSPTASMHVSRAAHTAILLPTGKVLVVGGRNKEILESAEIYDPSTRSWRETAPLREGRSYHTATLLPSGKVLVVGGTGSSGSDKPRTTAELYDPATGAWASAGRLANARTGHTATLLRTGHVLVVGGWGGKGAVGAAELYDYRTNRWSTAGSLKEARTCHSATLLGSGQVLVAAGARSEECFSSSSVQYVRTAELFDPATRRWSAAGNLDFARALHGTILLPTGNVILAGGWGGGGGSDFQDTREYDPATRVWSKGSPTILSNSFRWRHTMTLLSSGDILLAGGQDLRAAELYDPEIEWVPHATSSLNSPRHTHTATLLPSGKVLVIGGTKDHPFEDSLATAETYDPVAQAWSPAGSMRHTRFGHTATLLLSGKVLVVGGGMNPEAPPEAEIYDPKTGQWSLTGPPHFDRIGHSATLLPSGKVLVAGGSSNTALEGSSELYDPETGLWSLTGSLINLRNGHTSTLLPDGRVLVAGGHDGDYVNSAEIYDPVVGSWSLTGSLLISRAKATATLLPSGLVLVAGGYGNRHLSETEIYDPASGTWSAAAPLKNTRAEHEAILLPSGKVLVAGGWDGFTNIEQFKAIEIYDPQINSWKQLGNLSVARSRPTLTVLTSGEVLVTGGEHLSQGAWAEVDRLAPAAPPAVRRPLITAAPEVIRFGEPFSIQGLFRGVSEMGGGSTSQSSVQHPLVTLTAIEGGHTVRLTPATRANFWDEPMTITLPELPSNLEAGWYRLAVSTTGVDGQSWIVSLSCSIAVTDHPKSRQVPAGSTATFSVRAPGGRRFQWQKDGRDIPGAVGPTYTTPPVSGSDSGAIYRVRVEGGCASAISETAVLTIEDRKSPEVAVLSPSGGEYWLLSEAGAPAREQVITWSMSDDVRICRVDVSLLASSDGGSTYVAVPPSQDLPQTFGSSGSCPSPGVTASSVIYRVPAAPPSGSPGSLYKVQVEVHDHVGNRTTASSPNPFYIVQPNPDSVLTLILAHPTRMQDRMGIPDQQVKTLDRKLRELAAHPRVLGQIIDLGGITDLSHLFADWDQAPGDAARANRVLFGCHEPLPLGCTAIRRGVHDVVRELLGVYTGARYLVLVGDDRIIPFARVPDRTALLPERTYVQEGGLPNVTTVGQALRDNFYLSDDLVASLGIVRADEAAEPFFLPDLAVGRLVEAPEEIAAVIATFISRDGVLDISTVDPASGHKVLVTGYDFLLDSGTVIRDRWKNALSLPKPFDDSSRAPVNGVLLTPDWGSAHLEDRRKALRANLMGEPGEPYAIAFLNGHATHEQEGVPGQNPFDIQGLQASRLYGPDRCQDTGSAPLQLGGSVIFAVGCHGGLVVPGTCSSTSSDKPLHPPRSLDLPQTFLARGAVGYVANTGYGWGLVYGIGYGERLAQIAAEELTRGGPVVLGEAVRRTKLRYFLESPRFDPYDEKTTLQWTLFGLPMYSIRTGISGARTASFSTEPPSTDRPSLERIGRAAAGRRLATSPESAALAVEVSPDLPSYLTRLDLRFDFTGPDVYTKRNASGKTIDRPGCPAPARGEPAGCYYTLNGLVERATGLGDLPVQPYFVYDSRLSGTSQHGVLWKGGTYKEERGWTPVVGELISNGESGFDHGSTPRHILLKPRSRRRRLGDDGQGVCRPTDVDISSLVIPAGEALRENGSYSIQRRAMKVDLEVFYFNNTGSGEGNCDRIGPEIQPGPFAGGYHQVKGTTLEWAVPAVDADGDVWRVLVVYDAVASAESGGAWKPVELELEAGLWKGKVDLTGSARVTYVIQAVDTRGNVTWLDHAPQDLPSSGVDPDLPDTIEVEIR